MRIRLLGVVERPRPDADIPQPKPGCGAPERHEEQVRKL
jgi:hypothetical protein